MISKAMTDRLNQQIANELSASQKYLGMACWFDGMSLGNLCTMFRKQAEEERGHALKILDYVLEVGAKVVLGPLSAPPTDYTSVKAALEAAVASELQVTGQINDAMALAEQERDYATRSFLQWFVDEQVEEVSTMSDMVNLAALAKDNLLQFDLYVGQQVGKGEGGASEEGEE